MLSQTVSLPHQAGTFCPLLPKAFLPQIHPESPLWDWSRHRGVTLSEGAWPLPPWANWSVGNIIRAVLGNWEPWQHMAGTPNLFGDGGVREGFLEESLFFHPDFSVETSKRISILRVDSVYRPGAWRGAGVGAGWPWPEM